MKKHRHEGDGEHIFVDTDTRAHRWLAVRGLDVERDGHDLACLLSDVRRETIEACVRVIEQVYASAPDRVSVLSVPAIASAAIRAIRALPTNLQICMACSIEAEIGSEEIPHPVPARFHVCE